jgi:hypothetical protein
MSWRRQQQCRVAFLQWGCGQWFTQKQAHCWVFKQASWSACSRAGGGRTSLCCFSSCRPPWRSCEWGESIITPDLPHFPGWIHFHRRGCDISFQVSFQHPQTPVVCLYSTSTCNSSSKLTSLEAGTNVMIVGCWTGHMGQFKMYGSHINRSECLVLWPLYTQRQC